MAYSAIENKYLSALTAVQFPTEPMEPDTAGQPGDVLLAAGPSQTMTDGGAAFGIYPGMGRRSQKSNIGEKMITGAPDFAAGTVRGAATSALGFGGDIQKIGRFINALAFDNQGGGIMDKLSRAAETMADPTFLPSSIDVSEGGYTIPGTNFTLPGLPAAVPAGTSAFGMTPDDRQKAGEFGQNVGELVGDPFMMVKGGQMAARGVAEAGKALAPKAAEMTINALEKTGMPARGLGIVESGPNVVSTRLPTAVKATEDPLANNLVIDLQAAKTDPEAFNHNVGLVKQYPNFASKARNPEKQAEDFINEVKDNLLFLHDQVPDATRQRSKLWYDGARNITSKWSNEYQVPDQAVSGVLAVLSPQKDWFMNVSLGQRVLDIMSGKQAYKWDDGMTEMGKVIWSKPQYAPMVEAIKGKTLAEITDPGLKAMWLRTYDQAYLPREHQIVTPEGDFAGLRMNSDGKTPTKTGWGSLNEIGKAIVILGDPSKANISNNLGDMHKVRNFYNNIYAPNDPSGAVTIDTHAVAAGLLRPLSGNSREVMHNFGSGLLGEGGPKNSSITGVKGTYGLYAEAYRRAAQDRGILPREMQSITWEAVRGLFPDTFKTATNADKIDNIWLQYRKGKLSLDEARNEVFNAAGGINAPEWERAGLRPGAAPEVQPPTNQGQLPGTGVPGGTAGGMGSGERSGAATGDSSSVKRGRQARNSGAN